MINRDRLVKTFCDLVSIDSPSGEEDEIAAELMHRLEALGLPAAQQLKQVPVGFDEGAPPTALADPGVLDGGLAGPRLA